VPTENLRFRDESLIFKVSESATEEEIKRLNHYEYPDMIKVKKLLFKIMLSLFFLIKDNLAGSLKVANNFRAYLPQFFLHLIAEIADQNLAKIRYILET